jgi:ubiquinone/menaquinone biosynthesis C-methylase UbiE
VVLVELRQMDVAILDFPAASFDAAIATFLFCVLPDDQPVPALRELRRVVRPDGAIRLLEHVRPQSLLRSLSVAAWEPWAYGASFDRNTRALVVEARSRPRTCGSALRRG